MKRVSILTNFFFEDIIIALQFQRNTEEVVIKVFNIILMSSTLLTLKKEKKKHIQLIKTKLTKIINNDKFFKLPSIFNHSVQVNTFSKNFWVLSVNSTQLCQLSEPIWDTLYEMPIEIATKTQIEIENEWTYIYR